MKICRNCNKEYPDNLNFCTECGGALEEAQKEAQSVKEPEIQPEKEPGVKVEHEKASVPPPVPPVPGNGAVFQSGNAAQPIKKKGKVWKTLVIVVVAVAIVAGLVYSHFKNSTTYIRTNPSEILFTKVGGEYSVSIDYDGYMWDVTYEPSWCTVYKHDKSFTIYCDVNRSGSDREDFVTIKSGKLITQVYVGQYGHATYLELSDNYVKVDSDGGSVDIEMNTDGDDFEFLGPDYCSVSNQTSSGFTLSFDANYDSGRSGQITVQDGNTSASLSFYQSGICSACAGRGQVSCGWCGGTGQMTNYNIYGGYYMSDCSVCGGTGRVDCSLCGGTGER